MAEESGEEGGLARDPEKWKSASAKITRNNKSIGLTGDKPMTAR
jgi:hypothetical protein